MSVGQAPPIAFAGLALDRADPIRGDPAALAALIADPRARRLCWGGGDAPAISVAGELGWEPLGPRAAGGELVLLGLDQARAGRFVAVPPTPPPGPAAPADWAALALLAPADVAIYGAARALAGWHARHRWCSRCGHPSRIAKGGWQRTCTNPACRGEHFPRVDPVVIMLVEHEGGVLLGRQQRFPPGRYSALAGFVEPGETIEEAVAREVFEESAVRVRDVAYVASQPWPFPSSLMIACHAVTDDRAITIDRAELEDARWFTRDQVAQAVARRDRGAPWQGSASGDAFDAPPAHAIAHHLLGWWLAR